jgi:hypothetical protein
MSHSSRYLWLLITLSTLIAACAMPTITLHDEDTVSTAAAQTVFAQYTQAALSETHPPASLEPTLTPTSLEPTLTFTPETPTLTPTITLTPSLTLTSAPISTSTPTVPQISVSVPTNCRAGPGIVYQRLGALLVGEIAEVYGRDPTGNYWYIRNPDSPKNFCWLWGEYATVVGNISFLPVLTPPPTPTPTVTPTPSPDFDATYVGLDTCAGWWVEIRLKNTGSIAFKSIGLTVKDTVTNVVLAHFKNEFTNLDGCNSSKTKDTLGVDKKHIVSSPAFNYDPSGHKIHATIILCSDNNQSGTCITRTINFKP